VLKSDVFGRVERWESPIGTLVRRVPCGSRVPGSAWIARILARRERRALAALANLNGIPELVADATALGALDSPHGAVVRRFTEGAPLNQTEALPTDFFEHLARLVVAMHAHGVCHNDLHKEQNVIVRECGRPALIDFQLASIHRRRGRVFRSRAREDLRHVEKHRQRYVRQGRSRAQAGLAPLPARGALAALWRRWGKPCYQWITRGLLRWRDGEPRRRSSGPWPRWDPPLGATHTP